VFHLKHKIKQAASNSQALMSLKMRRLVVAWEFSFLMFFLCVIC
jgi:hypothetical protein